MKKVFSFICGVMLMANANASILGSELEHDHQLLIQEGIEKSCQVKPFSLEQISSQETIVRIDQGIRDVYFTTQLEMKVKIDQGVFDTFKVVVKSALFDHYDHANKRWGAYAIESVECTEKF